MSSMRLETFLARLFVDPDFRESFLRDPRRVVEEHGLDAAEQESALAIDRPGLLLTARSFTAKRKNRDVSAGAFQRARRKLLAYVHALSRLKTISPFWRTLGCKRRFP
jgi:hypothetical protein